jgi:hypothetical protein
VVIYAEPLTAECQRSPLLIDVMPATGVSRRTPSMIAAPAAAMPGAMAVPGFDRLPAAIAGRIDMVDGHWLWTGQTTTVNVIDVYGRCRIDGRLLYAHRVIKQLVTGEVQPMLSRVCPERLCVKPGHWQPTASLKKPNVKRIAEERFLKQSIASFQERLAVLQQPPL